MTGGRGRRINGPSAAANDRTVAAGPSPHPRVTVKVARTRPRYRELVDLRDPAAAMPAARSGALVQIEVGAGLSAQDLPQLVAVAERTRQAARVEIVGSNRAACDDARRALLKLWQTPVPAPPETGLGTWANLLVAHAAPPPT